MVAGHMSWFKRKSKAAADAGAPCSSSHAQQNSLDPERSSSLSVDAAVTFGSCEADCKSRLSDPCTAAKCCQSTLAGARVLLSKRPGWAPQSTCAQPTMGHLLDQDICFGPLLAASSTSQVYQATCGPTEVAVKVMASTSSSTTGTHVLGQQQLEQHLQQLVALDHPNVLQTYCAVTYAQDGAAAAGPTTQHTSHEFDYGPKACAGSKSSRDQHSPQQQQQQQPGMSPSTCADLETWLVQEFCDTSTLSSLAVEWQAAGAAPTDRAAVGAGDAQMLERLGLLADVARGLQYLHDQGIIHGELGASNILVSSSTSSRALTAKVSYTGILQSALKQQQQHAAAPASSQHDVATIATMRYVAPEVLRLGGYALRPESDVYAFGIVMWEAYAGQGAYRKLLDAAHLYEAIIIQNLRPMIPAGMPADYQLLMERCWASDPSDRPSTHKLIGCLAAMAAERTRRVSICSDRVLLMSATAAAGTAAAAAAAGGCSPPAAAGAEGLRVRSAPVVHNRSCDRTTLQAMVQQGARSRTPSGSWQHADQDGFSSSNDPAASGPAGQGSSPNGRALGPQGAGLLHHKSCPAAAFHALLLQSGGSFRGRCSESGAGDADKAAEADDAVFAELLEEEQMLQQLRANSQTQSGPGSAPLLHSTQPHQRYADGLDLGLLQLDEAHMWHI